MIYLYLNNQGDIAYMDSRPFKLEDSDTTILEIDQEFPLNIEGKTIRYEWDAEHQQVVFTYVDAPVEVVVEEYLPTQTEIQEQILLNTEYLVIMSEINTGE